MACPWSFAGGAGAMRDGGAVPEHSSRRTLPWLEGVRRLSRTDLFELYQNRNGPLDACRRRPDLCWNASRLPATVFDRASNQYFQVFRKQETLYQSQYAVDSAEKRSFARPSRWPTSWDRDRTVLDLWCSAKHFSSRLRSRTTPSPKVGHSHPATKSGIMRSSGRFSRSASAVTADALSPFQTGLRLIAILRLRSCQWVVRIAMGRALCMLPSVKLAGRWRRAPIQAS